jgi:Flp pilus assembly protein TadG
MILHIRRLGTGEERHGVSAVEFAIVLPFLAILVAGMVEFGRALTVRQVLNDAVRKAARTGAMPNRTTAHINQDVYDVLTDNGFDPADANIDVLVNGSSADASTAVRNDRITVRVSIPFSKVAWGPAIWLGGNTSISAELNMERHG